jgi:hypothetical protein
MLVYAKATGLYECSLSKPKKRCLHGKSNKTDCKDCCPEKHCFEHGMPMRFCGKCGKHPSICKHHRRRTRCVECAVERDKESPGGLDTQHVIGAVCIHHRRKYQCTECAKLGLINSSEICPCAIRKRYCSIHGGANLCVVCLSTTVLKVGTTCMGCNVDPAKVVRVKKREVEVMEWIKELPATYTAYNKSLASILLKDVDCGNSSLSKKLALWFDLVREAKTYYPDFMWTLENRHILLEIDEHQHKSEFWRSNTKAYANDHQRDMDMVQQISCISDKQIVVVRYNPDAFQTGFKRRSQYLSTLTCRDARKKTLLDTLNILMQTGNPQTGAWGQQIVYIRLFFDCTCDSLQTCQFTHAQGFDSVDDFNRAMQTIP